MLGVAASVASLAMTTGTIFALRPIAPVLSLGALYVLAVLVVAIGWGTTYAVLVSVASMLAFNFFFLPPTHTFRLRDSENWFALAVYLVIAVVVSELATRARRRTAEADQRRREAELLAEVSAALLEPGDVQGKLRQIAERAAEVLSVRRAHIELESLRRPTQSERAEQLLAGERDVGRIFFGRGDDPSPDVAARLLPALASLLAAATDRERLARKALEAETLRRSDAIKTAILRSVSHANLLDLARLEAGGVQPRPAIWTVDELIARALEAVGGEADRVVVRAAPSEPPPIRVDARQIERVLVNLIENALKFSPPDAPVEVVADKVEGEVVIRVSDGGSGLSPPDLERVFEPFERGGEAAERKGSGLGLAIAKGFAQANHGRIWAESEPGRGASFALALPAAELPVEARI